MKKKENKRLEGNDAPPERGPYEPPAIKWVETIEIRKTIGASPTLIPLSDPLCVSG